MPQDVTENIMSRLGVVDFIRAGAVCRWWLHCKISSSPPSSSSSRWRPKESPWLMLTNAGDHGRMLRISDNTIHRMDLSRIKNMRCVSSAFGWLIALELGTRDPFAFNPITGSIFRLPAMPAANFRFTKFILSPLPLPPSSSSDYSCSFPFVVVGIIRTLSDERIMDERLMFCRPSDESWTPIQNPLSSPPGYPYEINDAIFCNGCLYVCDSFGHLAVYDDLCGTPRILIGRTGILPERKGYLVESSHGELLMILVLQFPPPSPFDSCAFIRIGMHVFQLTNTSEGEEEACWMPVESLPDESLFIGFSQGMSFSTKDHPNLRSNSIYMARYFPVDIYNLQEGEETNFSQHDVGIYNLQDDTVHHLPLYRKKENEKEEGNNAAGRRPSRPIPVWFTPSLHF